MKEHENAGKDVMVNCGGGLSGYFIFTKCLDCNFSVVGEVEHCISCGGLNVEIDALDKKEFTIDY